jgi:FtsP/CotA-like multicopper oxidase with cupredoxin domain
VSLEVVTPGHELFSITENGYGKRTPFEEYRITNRGGQGVRNYVITPKTGKVVASRTVNPTMELIVISKDGIVIRTRMDSIRVTGRAAQGVSVINVAPGDSVAALATIEMGTTGGNGNGGGSKGEPEAKQPPLAGLESPAPREGSKKPVPIKGRKPQSGKSAPARAQAPARKPAAKKPPTKKVAAAKPAPKKVSSKKPAARKPASKKPAPKARPVTKAKSKLAPKRRR